MLNYIITTLGSGSLSLTPTFIIEPKNSPFARNIVVENCNKYCGYVPTREAFAENSDLYESSLCFHSCLIPEAGEILQKEALGILKELAE